MKLQAAINLVAEEVAQNRLKTQLCFVKALRNMFNLVLE